MAVTLREVAARSGYSVKTVSKVVNDAPHLKASTRAAVQRAVEELGYRPNLAARHLKRGRSGLLGLVVPDSRVPFFAELTAHVIAAADRHGLGVLVENTAGRDPRATRLVGGAGRLTDGLLVAGAGAGADGLPAAAGPVVVLDPEPSGWDSVVLDDEGAVRTATRHLIERGCRRPAALGTTAGAPGSMPVARLRGYRAALAEAGLPDDAALEVPSRSAWARQDGAVLLRELVARDVGVDGVVAFNDLLAEGALRAARELGIGVPEELLVVGIDDTEESAFLRPTLSTVDVGMQELAEEAVAALVGRLSGERTGGPTRRVVAHRLVVRESTGGPGPVAGPPASSSVGTTERC